MRLTRLSSGLWVRLCLLVFCWERLEPLPAWAAVGLKIADTELIIRYRSDISISQLKQINGSAKLRVRRQIRTRPMKDHGHPGLTIARSDLSLDKALALLRSDPAVEYAEPNYRVRTLDTSNDPVFTSGNLWGMYGATSTPANPYGSQAALAWAGGFVGRTNVYVAVIDDGMQITHPDLAPNVWTNPFDPPDGIDNDGNGFVDDVNGWNFVGGNNVVFQDQDNHGTHVAGTIGARGGNGLGVAGVNWNITLIPVKFLSGGSGNLDAAIEAIDYCVDLKARHGINLVAINASWGSSGYSVALHEAIIRAAKAGILFVAAAGNDSSNNDAIEASPANLDSSFGTLTEAPASYNNVISVAAIDSTGALASFSNYGANKVHIGAPGVLIYSTYPTNLIGGLSGTSMATPHVAGAVALYASTHPTATAAQIRAALLGAALPTPSLSGRTSTGGRLDLSTLISPLPSILPVSATLTAETWANGVIDPGEAVSVLLTLTNSSPFSTANLVGTLQSSSSVGNPSGAQAFGACMAGSGSVGRTFSFLANGTCGEKLTLALALQDGVTNLGVITFAFQLGVSSNVLQESFDGVAAPALPLGWTTAVTGTGGTWKTVAGTGHGSPNAVFAPNPNGVADNILTSPAIHVRSGSAILSFQQSFDLEPEWDGGVLELSIAGGPFSDILTAGGVFLQNGYNLILNSATIPLTGRRAWSGNSGGFMMTLVQLPSTCHNQDVQVRWRCGSDTSMGGSGWFVDSISLVDGYGCLLPDVTVNEDAPTTVVPFSIGQAAGQAQLTLSASSGNLMLVSNQNLVLGGSGQNRTVALTPSADQFGTGTVTLKTESGVETSYTTFNLIVNPVNDPPSFVAGGNVTALQDSGAQALANWAGAISPGPPNESSQALNFLLSVDKPYLFAVQPAIDSGGTLHFTPAAHQRGTALLTVQLQDSGGTAFSGQDRTVSQNFTITLGNSLDSDGDGMPDDFETAFGFDPQNSTDGGADFDGDGLTNYQEFLAGTDPFDARSVLRILAPADEQGNPGVQFTSVPNRSYRVDETSAFPTADWQPLAIGKAGTGGLVVQTDANATPSDSMRIYRVTTAGENGDEVHSGFAGFCRLQLRGSSDTFLSFPFIRPAAELGAIASVSGSTLQVRGTPGWASNAWVYNAPSQTNTYFLLALSGNAEGDYWTITSNSSAGLGLDAGAGALGQLSSGDRFAIVPYWTLGSLFPGGQSVHPSFSPGSRRTEILFPNIQGSGINLSSVATYYFWNGAWRQVGMGGQIRSDDVILPDMFVIVRHNIPTNTTFTAEGAVLSNRLRIPIRRPASGKQDNMISLSRPTSVSLDNSGLLSSGAFRASPSPGSRIDELLLFNNSVAGFNKSAVATYYYWNGAWRKVGFGSVNVGADLVFTPGIGFILRSGAGSSALWENSAGF